MKLFNQDVPFGTWGRSMTCMALASCLTYGTRAMTFSDLQEAVLTAQDGDTVWVMNDMEYTGTLDVGAKHLTLASADGATYTLTRAAGHGGALFEINDPRADVTIRDLVIDGNKGAGNFTTRPFITSAGRLTFGSGAVFQNFKSSTMSGPWYQTGGTNVLELGSLIRGCENSLWGTAILLGGTANFFMNGGMITECVGTSSNASLDYDGAVYLNGDNAHFWMSGGTITGNTSVNSVAGVNVYKGYFSPGLDACVTNNQGGSANDVSLSKGHMVVATEWGDFTGYLTLHVPSEPVVGTDTYPTIQAWCSRDCSALGLGNIVCEQWPQYVWDGRSLSGHYYAKWTHRVDLAGRNISGSLPEVCQRAEDGDVLVPFTNMVVSGTAIVSDGKRLTLAGQGRRIARTMGNAIFSVTNASLRLENVVLDGNKASVTNQTTSGMITLDAKANVELGEGTVIENAVSLYNTAGVGVFGESSRLTMEDGAVIRNCELVQTDGYGIAVRIGDGSTQDVPAVFRMTGGAITGNVAVTTKSAQGGYGGTIYCYGGTFEMSGGTVSQNVCAESSSGVNLYQGRLILSGTARIENNLPSAYPDVFIGGNCKENVVISGDFRGHVGVSSCVGSVNVNTEIVCAEGATGACRIFNARGDAPYGSLSAYMWSNNRKVYLYSAVAWIDGIGCPQYGAGGYVYEDIATLVPSTVDLDSPDGLASLPHTFKGTAARAFSGTLNVSFDPEQWASRSELPLTLLVTEDGPFTGNWSFVLPDATSGSWKVKKVNGANQNEAYVLSWLKPGVVLIIR